MTWFVAWMLAIDAILLFFSLRGIVFSSFDLEILVTKAVFCGC